MIYRRGMQAFLWQQGRVFPLNKYAAFFEKEFPPLHKATADKGGSKYTEADVSAFFLVKKSFSSSPRFPSPLIHKPEHGFEQGRGVWRAAGNVEIGFEDFFDTAASFGGVCVNTA